MTDTYISTATKTSFAVSKPRAFAQDENGAMTIFACFMILIMILVGGIGADLMRNEMERTRLQGISDRAVLAAADLDQEGTPAEVVQDYFDKAGLGEYVSSVTVGGTSQSRTVSVSAYRDMKTQFMHNVGVPTLPVPARATAQEGTAHVEVSLVLDISGSMRFSNRMTDLRPAASDFVDVLLEDGASAYTSINLIPYAGQTNPGAFMFDRLGGQRLPATALNEDLGGIAEHLSHGVLDPEAEGGTGSDPDTRYVYPNISSCLELRPSDFNSITLPGAGPYDQVSHFMNWNIAANVMDWGWCPQDQTSIQYLSNNATTLKSTINSMRMHDGTGTHYAMKYAVSLLDPSSRNDVTALVGAGMVDSAFAGRPAAYDNDDAAKFIVLMTDGQITEQVRPTDALDDENPSRELARGRGAERMRLTTSGTNVQSFFAQCDLAKTQQPRPVVVFTIAFEAPGVPEQQMRDCASSPAHFYIADGGSIGDVFQNIARQINQLRLTN